MGKKTSSSLCKVRKTWRQCDNVTMLYHTIWIVIILSQLPIYPVFIFLYLLALRESYQSTAQFRGGLFLGQSLQNIGQIGFSSGKYFNENNRNEIFLIQVWWKATVFVCVCVGSILSLWSVVIVKRPCRAFLSYCQYTPAPHLVYQHHTHEHDE